MKRRNRQRSNVARTIFELCQLGLIQVSQDDAEMGPEIRFELTPEGRAATLTIDKALAELEQAEAAGDVQ